MNKIPNFLESWEFELQRKLGENNTASKALAQTNPVMACFFGYNSSR
ncbi:MAG: hypothetical protein V7L10_16170 [Nostoc sp.]|nr:hypothetical protein [Nostoc sp. JL31]